MILELFRYFTKYIKTYKITKNNKINKNNHLSFFLNEFNTNDYTTFAIITND